MPENIPPCTPLPKCQQDKLSHMRPPPCPNPEKCLKRSIKKGTKKCPSALAQMKGKRANCDCKKQIKKQRNEQGKKKKKCVIL